MEIRYTGAPFFAGMSAFRMGTDLVHIFCEKNASFAIKSYSPDLIVHPYLERDEAKISEIVENVGFWLDRLSCLIVGPGAGRHKVTLEIMKLVIEEAKQRNLPMIIDAVSSLKYWSKLIFVFQDGLYLIQKDPSILSKVSSKDNRNLILTPNTIEFIRLCRACNVKYDPDCSDFAHIESCMLEVCKHFNHVTILKKGHFDMVSDGVNCSRILVDYSQPRRPGGQGDILCGILSAYLSWNIEDSSNRSAGDGITFDVVKASIYVMRATAHAAFEKQRRGVLASDMLEFISQIVNELDDIKM